MPKRLIGTLMMMTLASFAGVNAEKKDDRIIVEAPFPDVTDEQKAEFTRAAEFTIGKEVVAKDMVPWTYTIGDGPVNCRFSTGYEPFDYRWMWILKEQNPNFPDRVYLSKSWFQVIKKSGFWDESEVRVYRIVNKKMKLVRKGFIPKGNHHSSGWMQAATSIFSKKKFDSQKPCTLIHPDSTTVQYKLSETSGIGLTQYFTVKAIDKAGNVSDAAAEVSVTPTSTKLLMKARKHKIAPFKKFKLVKPKRKGKKEVLDTEKPLAPTGLTVSYDEKLNIATFNWKPSKSDDVAGYHLMMANYPAKDLKGYYLEFEKKAASEEEKIREGDLVFIAKKGYEISSKYNTHRLYNSTKMYAFAGMPVFTSDGEEDRKWVLEKHKDDLPKEFKNHGETCLRVDLKEGAQFFSQGSYGQIGDKGGYSEPLKVNVDYVVEFWAKQENMSNPKLTLSSIHWSQTNFKFPDLVFDLQPGVWKKYRKIVRLSEAPPAGNLTLTAEGPGTFWLDNLRMYEADVPFMDFYPSAYKELKDSGMNGMRTHSSVKSSYSYSMKTFTNMGGIVGYRGDTKSHNKQTLQSLLSIMEKSKQMPWLQIEMHMSDEEWLGFVEYIAAPYDPNKDTPESKPWAYKRYSQGRKAPWSDSFDRMIFELSNETWNMMFIPWRFTGETMPDSATGEIYQSGDIYGMLQDRIINVFKSSPYWGNLEGKMEFLLCGSAGGDLRAPNKKKLKTKDYSEREAYKKLPATLDTIDMKRQGYGHSAIQHTKDSKWVTVAAYNGGWDEGEGPPQGTKADYFSMLMFTPSCSHGRTLSSLEKMKIFKEMGYDYQLGTYEAGPGYAISGLNNQARMTKQQSLNQAFVKKSLAGGTATLDTFLEKTYHGYNLQNFFQYKHAGGWTYFHSHARWDEGGQGYPAWEALTLYNNYGTGDFLKVTTDSVPSWDVPKVMRKNKPTQVRREAVMDAPVVGCYASQKDDRFTLFLLSRKIDGFPIEGDDGYTPVTVNIPIKSAKKVTLYMLTGDPRSHNVFANNAKITSRVIESKGDLSEFIVNAKTGTDDRGLPPGSTFCYVFEGVE